MNWIRTIELILLPLQEENYAIQLSLIPYLSRRGHSRSSGSQSSGQTPLVMAGPGPFHPEPALSGKHRLAPANQATRLPPLRLLLDVSFSKAWPCSTSSLASA